MKGQACPEEILVPSTLEPLILDLLEWIGPHPRPYAEVMEAWRTSCPRLPVWEESNERGFIEQRRGESGEPSVFVSNLGAQHLIKHRSATTHMFERITHQ